MKVRIFFFFFAALACLGLFCTNKINQAVLFYSLNYIKSWKSYHKSQGHISSLFAVSSTGHFPCIVVSWCSWKAQNFQKNLQFYCCIWQDIAPPPGWSVQTDLIIFYVFRRYTVYPTSCRTCFCSVKWSQYMLLYGVYISLFGSYCSITELFIHVCYRYRKRCSHHIHQIRLPWRCEANPHHRTDQKRHRR